MISRIKILLFVILSAIGLYLAHVFALRTNLYWTTSWADSVTHTLGGVVVGSVFIYLASYYTSEKSVNILTIITQVFVVGVLWEVFELYGGLTFMTDKGYFIDTLGDLFFDILGAYIGYLTLIKESHE